MGLFFYYSSVNFKQSTGTFGITNFFFSVLSQVEDAMLMFDKTTNRHRGKCLFVLCVCVSVLLHVCVCNVIMNVLHCAVSSAVHSCAPKTLKREFSV